MAKKKIQEQEQELELVREMNRQLDEERQSTVENDSSDDVVSAAAALPDDEEETSEENKKKSDDGNKSSQTKLTEEEKKKLQEEEEKKSKEAQKNQAAKKAVKNIGKNRLSSMSEIELAQYLLKLCYDPSSLVTGEPGFENIEAVVKSFYQRFGQMDKTAQQYVENRFQFEVQRMSTSQQMVITNSSVKQALYERESQNPTLLKDTVSFVTDEKIGTYDSTTTDFTSLHTINALMSMGYNNGEVTARRNGSIVTIKVAASSSVTTSKGRTVAFTPVTVTGGPRRESIVSMNVDGKNIDMFSSEGPEETEIEKIIKTTNDIVSEVEDVAEKVENGTVVQNDANMLRKGLFDKHRNAIQDYLGHFTLKFASGFLGNHKMEEYTVDNFANDLRAYSNGIATGEKFNALFGDIDEERYEKLRNQLKTKYLFKRGMVERGIDTKLADAIASLWDQKRGERTANKDGRVTTSGVLAATFSMDILKDIIYERDEKTGIPKPRYDEKTMSIIFKTFNEVTQDRMSEIIGSITKERAKSDEYVTNVERFNNNQLSVLSEQIEIKGVTGKGFENVVKTMNEQVKTASAGKQDEPATLQHTELTSETLQRQNDAANGCVNEVLKNLERDRERLSEQVASAFKTSSQMTEQNIDSGRNFKG